jgi:hypothetical protein
MNLLIDPAWFDQNRCGGSKAKDSECEKDSTIELALGSTIYNHKHEIPNEIASSDAATKENLFL